MDVRRLVGLNVKRLRQAAGLTQEQLSERSGRSPQYISKLESGLCNPTVVTLTEIAKVLNASAADLITA